MECPPNNNVSPLQQLLGRALSAQGKRAQMLMHYKLRQSFEGHDPRYGRDYATPKQPGLPPLAEGTDCLP